MTGVRLEADDVTIVPIDPAYCDTCHERPATHFVMLDMRALGMRSAVAEACESCATELAASLSASLAPSGSEP